MEDRFYARLRPYLQIIFLALVAIVCFFVFNFLAIQGAMLIYDVPLADLTGLFDGQYADNIPLLKFVQILNSIGLFIVPAIFLALLASSKPFRWLGFNHRLSWRSLTWLLFIIVAAQPIVAWTGVVNQNLHLPDFLHGLESWMERMEDNAMELTESFLEVSTLSGLLVNLLMVAVIPAFGEEMFFRGMIQPIFTRWFKNVHVAVIVTAFFFSALHMQFYGFLPRFILGILFGYLFVWSKNLWFPILAHLLHNTIPVVAYFFYTGDLTESTVDSIATGSWAWTYALLSVFLLVWFSRNFTNSFKPKSDV